MSRARREWIAHSMTMLVVLGLVAAGGCTSDGPGLPESPPEFVLQWGSTGNPVSNLQWPIDAAVGRDGTIYVAELTRGRVLKYTPEGDFLAVWDIGTPANAELEHGSFNPAAIAVDTTGLIFASALTVPFVARLDTRSGSFEMWSYEVPVGGLDATPDGTVFLAGFRVPHPDLYEMPEGPFIWKLSRDGDVLAKWTPRVPPGRTWQAGPLACTPGGGVLVVDAGSNRVQEYSETGALVSDWGLVDPLGAAAEGLAMGPDGRVYVSRWGTTVNRSTSTSGIIRGSRITACAVEVYSRDGRLLSVVGREGIDPGEFPHPYGVAVDATGALYVADYHAHRVQKFAYP